VAATLWPANSHLAPKTIGQLLLLGVLGGAMAYLLFYRLIAMHGPVFTANVNLLIPVWGVLWGWLLLAERIPAISFLGMTLVVGGLALVLWPGSAGAAQPADRDQPREARYSAR